MRVRDAVAAEGAHGTTAAIVAAHRDVLIVRYPDTVRPDDAGGELATIFGSNRSRRITSESATGNNPRVGGASGVKYIKFVAFMIISYPSGLYPVCMSETTARAE